MDSKLLWGQESIIMRAQSSKVLAIDLGATSGRLIVGWKNDKGDIEMEKVSSFPNVLISKDGRLYWDLDRLIAEIKDGMKEAIKRYPAIQSFAIDSWGVDYVLMNGDRPIGPFFAYRDNRTKEAIEKVHSLIPFEELYKQTGTQFQPFNTIYQLVADSLTGRLEKATSFLMIPEYVSFALTGKMGHEFTNASTTGLLDYRKGEYDKRIISRLGLKASLFTSLKRPGHDLGPLKKEVAQYVGKNLECFYCASHDTASAVEGIPQLNEGPYLSSGTWSLLGIRRKTPNVTPLARRSNYSNEAGPSYVRFQKNIMGLWIFECLKKELSITLEKALSLAEGSDYEGYFSANDPSLLDGKAMKNKIEALLITNGFEPPNDKGALFRSVFLSLAHCYKEAIEELEEIEGRKFTSLTIVGGGAKNALLNSLTEEVTKKKIIAYPLECSARGNIKCQQEAIYGKEND